MSEWRTRAYESRERWTHDLAAERDAERLDVETPERCDACDRRPSSDLRLCGDAWLCSQCREEGV